MDDAWCSANAGGGVDKVPTRESPLCKIRLLELVRELDVPGLYVNALNEIEVLGKDNEGNKKFMEDAGVARAVILLLIRCYDESKTMGTEQALRILCHVWTPSGEIKAFLDENHRLIDCLTWILGCEVENHVLTKTLAMLSLKRVIEASNTRSLEKLKPEFMKQMLTVIKSKISQQATKSSLQVLIQACLQGRNKMKIVKANAIFELIEFELEKPEKNISELIFNLLAHLCSCADGRAEFLRHAGSIAMVAKRILRVSPATDDQAVCILSSISKNAATKEVLLEMLKVGAVTKLCMVIQADCPTYLKQKARGVL
ncbi:hypothetical protein F3Y22_tig00110882pilonHSYRG00107 [Hibiscus syriacus]|uniref:U-box domain-containing protein n=1 Tax=Hibiscus syriacus TaxID=106335 RepID=A0A6A2ZKR1_HIBSY|nr:hypothetical protein F3Y22_tig00110882pilonHSYRG00107 [Hibiscus syriacus]